MERENNNDLRHALIEASKQMSTQTIMFHQTVAAHLGLNITDHKCLDFILGKGRATAGQLADWTGLTTGAITSVLNRLEKSGYIRRTKDASDLRVVYAEPVFSQLQGIYEVFGPLGESMLEVYARYNEHELETILDYMRRSNRILRDHTEALRSKR